MEEDKRLINNLKSDRTVLQNKIQNNLEKIQRLKMAKTRITHDQEDFWSKKTLISEPDLSSEWVGKHANELMDFRADMEQSYRSINTEQVEEIITDIENKIDELASMNEGYSNSISSINYRLSLF
ncbi:DUF5082 family protein [Bacillus carboniphilus]|uniref:DUF5082 family protein n=1 Tax=Bacillus carboniphilus TaxID=86663 RepID=A0ABY9JYV5_9BACI|nr:DUF5082 family protein [Bacillus carboniphilus]WLR42811.1 DUF5082 family protein [Bacillus carboniphilus]